MFFTSVFTPSPDSPERRTETFASTRRLPFSMSQSETAAYSSTCLSVGRGPRAPRGGWLPRWAPGARRGAPGTPGRPACWAARRTRSSSRRTFSRPCAAARGSRARSPSPRWADAARPSRFLERRHRPLQRVGRLEHLVLEERLADELPPDRQALHPPDRDRHGGQADEVRGAHEDVGEVHLHRLGELLL